MNIKKNFYIDDVNALKKSLQLEIDLQSNFNKYIKNDNPNPRYGNSLPYDNERRQRKIKELELILSQVDDIFTNYKNVKYYLTNAKISNKYRIEVDLDKNFDEYKNIQPVIKAESYYSDSNRRYYYKYYLCLYNKKTKIYFEPIYLGMPDNNNFALDAKLKEYTFNSKMEKKIAVAIDRALIRRGRRQIILDDAPNFMKDYYLFNAN